MELHTTHRKLASLTCHEGNGQCYDDVLRETQQWSRKHNASCPVGAAAQAVC